MPIQAEVRKKMPGGLELVCSVALAAMALALLCAGALYRTTHREQPDAPGPSNVRTATSHPADSGASARDGSPDAADTPQTQGAQVLAQTAGQDGRTFSFTELRDLIVNTPDLAMTLRSLVDGIRAREGDDDAQPLPVELFFARQLEEADLDALANADDQERPVLTAVQLSRTGQFYLRCPRSQVPYRTGLAVIRVEAALNTLCAAHDYFGDLDTVDEEHLYRLASRVQASVCAQAASVDTADWTYLAMPWLAHGGPSEKGEWSLRFGLADALESCRLPYRLQARFRSNVAAGDAALEFQMTPAKAFPRSAYVGDLGIVPTTADMRRRAASEYAGRVALLVASHAFNASPRLRRVWVAAVLETPRERSCRLSFCVDRKTMAHLDLSAVRDPLDTLRRIGATLEEHNGILMPSVPCFYLEDERFCPPMRHDLWQMSERSLPASAARSLGAAQVSGLSIHEELPRVVAAEHILATWEGARQDDSTQREVKTVLAEAGKTSDLTVWDAAERVARKLVEGSLSSADPESVRQEFVDDGGFGRAVEQAQHLIAHQRPDEAIALLRRTVGPVDAAGTYVDTDAIAYRCFDSFAERVVYNRLNAHDARSVVLVPDAYLLAELTLSALLLAAPAEAGGDATAALEHAKRALAVAPLNTSANIGMAACLEAGGDNEGAARQLTAYLASAYHPQGIAFAYFRLAPVMEALGQRDACVACYRLCLRAMPHMMPFVLMACQDHEGVGNELMAPVDHSALEKTMREAHIPFAPSSRIAYILYDGACASVDAEVFPVARDLMHVIEALTGDDVMHAIRDSLEREPDV